MAAPLVVPGRDPQFGWLVLFTVKSLLCLFHLMCVACLLTEFAVLPIIFYLTEANVLVNGDAKGEACDPTDLLASFWFVESLWIGGRVRLLKDMSFVDGHRLLAGDLGTIMDFVVKEQEDRSTLELARIRADPIRGQGTFEFEANACQISTMPTIWVAVSVAAALGAVSFCCYFVCSKLYSKVGRLDPASHEVQGDGEAHCDSRQPSSPSAPLAQPLLDPGRPSPRDHISRFRPPTSARAQPLSARILPSALRRVASLPSVGQRCETPGESSPHHGDDQLPSQMRPELQCPITLQVMRDPVIAADGHTYERDAIRRWFTDHSTSPVTGAQLRNFELIPNIALRSLISSSLA